MKNTRLPLLAALGLLLAPFAASQTAQWRRQFPDRPSDHRSVHMLSGLDGWVAGSGGELRHTSNGGTNWSDFDLPTEDVRSITFRGGALGWAGGNGLFRTTDFGQTWVAVSSEPGVNCIWFVDSQRGFACTESGRVLRTTDGGASWTGQNVVQQALLGVHFVDALTGWAVGASGRVLASVDGGSSWLQQDPGTGADLTAVEFASSTTGWIAAGPAVLRTTNGGQTWISVPLPAGVEVHGLDFLGSSLGWAAGPGGTIVHTSDGGLSWVKQLATSGVTLRDVAMGDAFNGLAVGDRGNVWRTIDGTTWNQVTGSTMVPYHLIRGLAAVDAQHAWAAATETSSILRTTDGGETWVAAPAGTNTIYDRVSFADTLNGYACGTKQAFYPMLAATHDGGVNWTFKQNLGMYRFHDVEALDAATAIVVGETFVFRTTNGGASWSSFAPLPYGTWWGVDFVGPNVGWMVGQDVRRSDDGGLTWNPLWTNAVEFLDVSFADTSTGWMVGPGGAIEVTHDGGLSWAPQISGTGVTLRAVQALSNLVAWVCGDDDFVARTIDGGASWTRLVLPKTTIDGLRTLAFVAPDVGWVGGDFEAGIWHRGPAAPACEAQSYCQAKTTSLGTLPRLSGTGAPSLASNAFQVRVAAGVPGKIGLLVYGTGGPASTPFLGGVLCAAPPIKRLGAKVLDGSGATAYPIPIDAALVGTTRWYQFWHRDLQNPDGTAVALSDGLMVSFCD